RAAKNASLQADKEEQYDNLKNQIDATNIRTEEFESALDAVSKDPTKYKQVVEDTKAKFPDFPARQTALDEFSDLYKQYLAVKGSIDDAGDLKRLLKGSGVLEFHILVDDANSSEVMAMRERLPKSGPRPQAGDTTRWILVDRPEEVGGAITGVYNGKVYALVSTLPEQQMVNGEGIAHWALERAFPTNGQLGETVVGFEFDPQGAKYFSELTRI